MLLITVDFISLPMVVAAGHVASGGDLGARQFKGTSGREEGMYKAFIAGSQLTSGGFIMLAEKSDVFPSSPEGLTALFMFLLVCPEQKK